MQVATACYEISPRKWRPAARMLPMGIKISAVVVPPAVLALEIATASFREWIF